jgi:hypothetical protein
VLFSGAMTYVIAPMIARILAWVANLLSKSNAPESGASHG